MHWQQLEELIQDHQLLTKGEVEKYSTELLQNVKDDTKPLHAARVAYTLALLQLKSKKVTQVKVLEFVDHLRKILKHEINMAELKNNEEGDRELIHVRKLAEHYFHHLMVLAELREASKVSRLIHKIRQKNHDALLKLNHNIDQFWNREQALIQKTVKRHYLFAGFLFAIALYFTWTSFWGLTDFLLAQWVYSTLSTDSVSEIVHQALMLVFALGFLWAFAKYQGGGGLITEESD